MRSKPGIFIPMILLYLLFYFMPALAEETADELVQKGYDLFQEGKHEEAIACFDKVLKIAPDYAFGW